MEQAFINILKQLVKEQGSTALTDAKKCKSFLGDYTQNKYKKESYLLLQAVNAGVAKKINDTDDLPSCKRAQIGELNEDYGVDSAVAADIVNTLALVLRGDTTVTVSPNDEKAAAWDKAVDWNKAVVEAKAAAVAKAVTWDKAAAETKATASTSVKGKKTWTAFNTSYMANEEYFYEGDLVNNIPNGKGKFIWPNGTVYEGDCVNGKAHGKGKKTYSNGNVFEGEWVKDDMHGKGKYIYSNGHIQEGTWKDGRYVSKY